MATLASFSISNTTRPANPRTDAAVSEPAKGNVKAFGALAGYLFGKNGGKIAMAMTSPVLMTDDDEGKTMSFVLPSKYWNKAAPKPLPGSGVQIHQVQADTRSVLMFGGYAVNVKERQSELLKLVNQDYEYQAVPGERPILAQYNDPFTPPWKRLNEVSIAVQPRS